jgi:hypothetical protein
MNGRIIVAAVLAVVAIGITGCTARGTAGSQVARTTPAASPSKNPLTDCVEQLVYWAGENLRRAPDQAYDYQHMGLTAEKYDELRKIETAGRALQAKGKLPATWVQDQSRAACIRILATPAPTNTAGGWPQ